jgi:hypothetical protein
MCHGMSLPYSRRESLPEDLIQHIVETHFPLKCNKCTKIFETVADLEQIGKCCIITSQPEEATQATRTIVQPSVSRKRHLPPPEITVNTAAAPSPTKTKLRWQQMSMDSIFKAAVKREGQQQQQETEETVPTSAPVTATNDALTPLTELNLRWRRKSKDFNIKAGEDQETMQHQQQKVSVVTRSTSTPVPMQNSISDSINSLQYSSIRYSSSSDNDFSPPPTISQKLPPPPPMPTPKSAKKCLSQSKKLPVQTPLRQVMAKSIQKAIVTHGHYKNLNLQQRKMSFDSSTSSNERTVSLMKLNDSRPLDLRTSPALKRELFDIEEVNQGCKKMTAITEDVAGGSGSNVDFKYEEIQVIYQTEKSSIVTNYRSCYSESVTPKVSGNNLLKKTISFESPAMLERTPAYLIPSRSSQRNCSQNDHDQDDNNNSMDTTVFYTPKSTPARPALLRRMSTPELTSLKQREQQVVAPKPNFWKYMTSVVGNFVGGGGGGKAKTEESTASSSSSSLDYENKWTAALQNPLRAAAEYFVKTTTTTVTTKMDDESRAQKRRHSDDVPITSPPPTSYKRRRIQGRKPIRRLLNDN